MPAQFDVVVIGGGAGGIATASSLLRRDRNLSIAIVEPSAEHRYQPGLTLVGGGVFGQQQISRPMSAVIPRGVKWIKAAATAFEPDSDGVLLSDGARATYRALVVAPGIKLDWNAVDGLSETLGSNGVTSNYDLRHAPYTWQLVRDLRHGRAVFTQPPMPIKCAGAPQKAMYLSCYEWEQQSRLNDIEVSFHNAGAALFGVADYVPALERYIDRYGIDLAWNQNLVAVDGPGRVAYFDLAGSDRPIPVEFDLLHVCPPQTAPDFIRNSQLSNEAGWLEVASDTLRHLTYDNVFGVGDVCGTANAKTAAAVRKQAPVVAENVLSVLAGRPLAAVYDGYGSCPLTVERGKVVLAEFGYGGKLMPTVPEWINDGTAPTRLGWLLKARLLPPIYFDLMLKGREWLASPEMMAAPTAAESPT